jgi:hypothetical protein
LALNASIERKLKEIGFSGNWTDAIRETDVRMGVAKRRYNSLDPALQFRILTENSALLSAGFAANPLREWVGHPGVRAAHDLRSARNLWAHNEQIDEAIETRAFESGALLMDQIGNQKTGDQIRSHRERVGGTQTGAQPVAPSAEEALHSGNAADARGDWETAKRHWSFAAEHGNTMAMRELAWHAFERDDLELARRWWRDAVRAGSHQAMTNLVGIARRDGHVAEEARWFSRMAQDGSELAASALFDLHLGDGVPPDQKEYCLASLRVASAARNPHAAYLVAVCTDEDDETPSGYEIALRYAASLGSVSAYHSLGSVAKRKGHLTEARVWYQSAVEGGSLLSAWSLGEMALESGDKELAFSIWKSILAAQIDPDDHDRESLLKAQLLSRWWLYDNLGQAGRGSEADQYFKEGLLAGDGWATRLAEAIGGVESLLQDADFRAHVRANKESLPLLFEGVELWEPPGSSQP